MESTVRCGETEIGGTRAMTDKSVSLQLLPENLAICRLKPDSQVPDWIMQSSFYSVTRTLDEVSVVCPEEFVPEGTEAERGWKVLRVEGPLAFSMTGVLACLTAPLAQAGISIFVLSTYDTDYLLVRDGDVASAIVALQGAGHTVVTVTTS